MRVTLPLLLVVAATVPAHALMQAYSVEPVKASWSGFTDTIFPNNYVSQTVTCNWDALDSTCYVEPLADCACATGAGGLESKHERLGSAAVPAGRISSGQRCPSARVRGVPGSTGVAIKRPSSHAGVVAQRAGLRRYLLHDVQEAAEHRAAVRRAVALGTELGTMRQRFAALPRLRVGRAHPEHL
jgi:hypothetical protein